MPSRTVVCLMGPTATGKTGIAVRLQDRFPIDIISVDSALVYRGMNIGTAKPDADTLARAPHRLIDIREPSQHYSAGDFVADASHEIDISHRARRIPLLVGGTMMYFRSLTEGLADLPSANADIRRRINAEAAELGWPHLHERLSELDPTAAARINVNDSQRIQRALEVHEISGKTLTDWHADAHADNDAPSSDHRFIKFALIPADRPALHRRIAARLEAMVEQGFVDEVRGLRGRPGVSADSPSMRAVGYRQFWAHLDGDYSLSTASHKALVATRQLAKRQLTWLRSEKQLRVVDPLEVDPFDAISGQIASEVAKQLDE